MLPDEERAAFLFSELSTTQFILNNMQKDYKPVSCELYDKLTEASVLRRKIRLQTGVQEPIKEVYVQDIITLKGEEFLVTSQGEHIRLDKVVLMPKS
ncbi:MAG: hypothetical protein ACKVPJ_10025 [Chitinophagales bacterium]